METNFFGLCVCVLQVTLAYESIVLCMYSGKYNDIYFYMKITFFCYMTYGVFLQVLLSNNTSLDLTILLFLCKVCVLIRTKM